MKEISLFLFLSESILSWFCLINFFLQRLRVKLLVAVQTSEICYILTPSTRTQKDSRSGCGDGRVSFITFHMLWHKSAKSKCNMMHSSFTFIKFSLHSPKNTFWSFRIFRPTIGFFFPMDKLSLGFLCRSCSPSLSEPHYWSDWCILCCLSLIPLVCFHADVCCSKTKQYSSVSIISEKCMFKSKCLCFGSLVRKQKNMFPI